MNGLRRTLGISVATMAGLFLLTTAVGYVALLSQQKSQHARELLDQHTLEIVLIYLRILLAYLVAGGLLGLLLHPLAPGWRVVPAILFLSGCTFLYQLTAGTHLLYGPVHSLVAYGADQMPALIRGLYHPVQMLAVWGAVAVLSLLLWSRRLGGRFLLLTGSSAAALLAVQVLPFWSTRPPGGRPNFLLLASDSLRADHLTVNGYGRPTTPNIDALAARGVNFDNCLVPTASTHESWISLLSSTHPRTNGLRHMFPSRELVSRVLTEQDWFPDLLRKQGYRTAVVGGWCGSTFDLFDVGFEQVDVSNAQNSTALIAEAAFTNHLLSLFFLDNAVGRLAFPELDRVSMTRAPKQLAKRAADRIDELAASDEPFFLVAVFHGTHLPYSSMHPYYRLFTDPEYSGRNRYRIDFEIDQMIQKGFDHDLSPAEQEHLIALYDGCVREFDDQVGALVEHLSDRGLLEQTIVGVFADHGDDLYEHGTTLGHGVTLFGGDQANRVPAIFAGPGIEAGRTEKGLVRSYDLTPTWCSWLSVPAPESFEGVDLSASVPELSATLETSYLLYRQPVPDLRPGEQPMSFPPFDEATFFDPEFDDNLVVRDEFLDRLVATKCFAVREGRWKLIHVPGVGAPIRRLFDLEADPECRVDRSADHPEVLARLTKQLPAEASTGSR